MHEVMFAGLGLMRLRLGARSILFDFWNVSRGRTKQRKNRKVGSIPTFLISARWGPKKGHGNCALLNYPSLNSALTETMLYVKIKPSRKKKVAGKMFIDKGLA